MVGKGRCLKGHVRSISGVGVAFNNGVIRYGYRRKDVLEEDAQQTTTLEPSK